MNPDIKAFFDRATSTVTYVVSDPATGAAAVIDPVLDYDAAAGRTATASADAVVDHVRQAGLTVRWVLDTHVHADHLSAMDHLKGVLGAATGIGDQVGRVQETFRAVYGLGDAFAADGRQFDRLFGDGETFAIGNLTATVLHVPGHTPACSAYLIGDACFVGDTLFMPDYGSARCDFPNGDARALYRSVRRLLDLPGETRLFMCHDYGAEGRDIAWETTVAAQRAGNIHLHDGVTEDDFVAMRTARDRELNMPALILPAVQVNIRAGRLPDAEAGGGRFLKIPLNVF
ncbi:MAG: MBL fold metallo-hydrolase [Hyphomicrobiales bacterium]|nr:MBL fold metallo-hydrolase [Hyphomicrobiales bacterium]MCP5374065.1 MBL fold metallo-hydrolase [Hyphomicrobiales bacterium]